MRNLPVENGQRFEELLGVAPSRPHTQKARRITFSCILFSDVREDLSVAQKYGFARDIALFADRSGCTAVYIPERHFSAFGAIYPNPAIIAGYLIPQTERVRFRTAGVVLPLHHPLEIVEWWATNDVLSNGRVDLGFAMGWNKSDFVLAPAAYEPRRKEFFDRVATVQRLWRGDALPFPGPAGAPITVAAYPRPTQRELSVWILAARSEESFFEAGRRGHNVFTMLYGSDLASLSKKIDAYRRGRTSAQLDPASGVVSLMLHTLVHEDEARVEEAVRRPFRDYLATSLDAHLREELVGAGDRVPLDAAAREKMVEYAYGRYFATGALFGDVDRTEETVERAIESGVDEIAFLLDFGADYGFVKGSFAHLQRLMGRYL